MSRPPGNLARRGRRRRLPLLALALAAATSAGLLVASPWQRPGPAPPTVERALAAVLDAGAPGLVAQVQDGARSWTEAKGLANLNRQAPMRPRTRTLCVLAIVRVDRVWASLLNVRRTSCAVRSRRGTFPISIVTGRSRSTCDRTVLSASPSSASAAQSSTALATV